MVQDVRAGFEDDFEAITASLEVGDQDFDVAAGHALLDFTDRLGKDFGTADIVVIAVHAGDDGVLQAQGGYGFGYTTGFVEIDGFGATLGNRAKAATAGADVA